MANTAIRTPAVTDARYAEEAWRAHELRVQGWPLRRIGQAMHMSTGAVQRRIDWANKQLALPVVLEYRKTQNERLENLLAVVLEGVREPVLHEGVHVQLSDGTPLYRPNLEAVEKARKLIDSLSDLHGVKAAVQIDHRVLQVTEEDLALIDEINAMAAAEMMRRGVSHPEGAS